jgi:dienelactone hydrolase
MSTMIPMARGSVPRKRQLRRSLRSHSANLYALEIGNAVCDLLAQSIATAGMKLSEALAQALKQQGFENLRITVYRGEVHAFIGARKDYHHGHVIVPIRRRVVRYWRGYGMRRGYWNHHP